MADVQGHTRMDGGLSESHFCIGSKNIATFLLKGKSEMRKGLFQGHLFQWKLQALMCSCTANLG